MTSDIIYAINIAQFMLGAIITIVNLILWFAIAVNPNLRAAPHCLLGNMWFANLLLGIIVAVSNVVDQSDVYVFQKTEGTVAIVNGFVTVSMLLALTTNHAVTIRNPSNAMSTKTAFKIIIAVWTTVLTLTLIKAIVFGLNKIGTVDACFKCFLSFEVSTLVIFALTTLVAFFFSIYLVCSHRNRTISDSSASNANSGNVGTANGGASRKEYKMTLTIGLLLFGFSLTFLAFIFIIPAWLTNASLDVNVAEIIITLFYTHSIINPIIVLCRDEELRKSAGRIVRCQRPTPANEPQPHPPQTTVNGSRQSMNTLNQPAQVEPDNRFQEPANNKQAIVNQSQPQRKIVHLPPIETPATRDPGAPYSEYGERTNERNDFERARSPEPVVPTAPPTKERPRGLDV